MQISKQWVIAYEGISPRNITMKSYRNLKSHKRNGLVFSTSWLFKELHLSINNEYLIFSRWFESWWIPVLVLDNNTTILFPVLLSGRQHFILPTCQQPLDLSNKACPMLCWDHDHPAGWDQDLLCRPGLPRMGWTFPLSIFREKAHPEKRN